MRPISFTVIAIVAFLPSRAFARPDPAPSEAAFAEQVRRLNPKNDKGERLEALRWLSAQTGNKNVAVAIPALEGCLREDPDPKLRERAAGVLCDITRRLDLPCSAGLLEALHDPVDEVGWTVVVWAGLFKSYGPGGMDVLLRGCASEKPGLRSNSLLLLARAAPKEPKALDAMRKATRDASFSVRQDARIALFRATDNLDDYVAYLIRLREDPDAMLSPAAEDSELRKKERMQRNLYVLGSGMLVWKWSEERADEFAAVLMKLLRDEAALTRRGAANLIAAAAVKVELRVRKDGDPPASPFQSEGTIFGSMPLYLQDRPLFDPKDFTPVPLFGTPSADPPKQAKPAEAKRPAKTPPEQEKSKVTLRLEKLNVTAELRRLRDDDPDRSVRDAARGALERLASLNVGDAVAAPSRRDGPERKR